MNAAKKNIQLVECPKCAGTKHFDHFRHIASGVCFRCGGAGKVEMNVGEIKPPPPMSDDARAKAEFVMNATDEQISRMTWKQISESHRFVHWHYAEYPTLREVWFEKFGARFGELQDIAWQEAYDKRMGR